MEKSEATNMNQLLVFTFEVRETEEEEGQPDISPHDGPG